MKSIVTAKQIASMDRYAIDDLKIPGITLMENAGRGIAEIALSLLGRPEQKRVHVYCGPGNNGGDGYVVARHLSNRGADVRVFILAKQEKIQGDALINLEILMKMGQKVSFIEKIPQVEKPALIVDAMLGTGVAGSLRGLFAKVAEFINSQNVPVLSVDIPTGVNADTGAVEGPAIRATATATMALLKRGLVFSPGREYAGRVHIVDISMPPAVVKKKQQKVWLLEKGDIVRLLPVRSPDAHKNKCGTVATVAGSEGFTGAASLSSEAALRAGAGLSYLCIPQSLNPILETKLTEVITWPFDDAGMGYLHKGCFREMIIPLQKQNVVAIGPGLGQHDGTAHLVHLLLEKLESPMVLDADGLNVCAGSIDKIQEYRGEMILTPHPGELSRLIGLSAGEIVANRIEVAKETAVAWNKVLVLKGGPTIIAFPDGRVFVNSTGNAGMATAGSGDVLTGVIAAFLAQGLDAGQAARAGVYVHGLAGDLARNEIGEMGMLASDILRFVPKAILALQGGWNEKSIV
ncbi:MAG: NAD(P)H-hydrate dehydratase [Calditrichaeota bacterium]|nr:NAD(P)H-hydrate dehydratase [Calditrichota bacterium]